MQADTEALRFGVLGPLEVTRGGPLPLRGPLQRRLLAALLTGEGRPVPVEALTEAMWDARPPRDARNAFLVCLHRLRRTLGEPERIALGPGGYRIGVSAADFDAAAFAARTAAARRERAAGRLEAAADRYADAAALWRGDPYAGLADTGPLRDAADRLDEDRLLARQEHLEIRLDLGDHEAAAELADLARAHPFRERLTALRMLALHRAGRRAESLQVYREARAALGDGLGIDPGPPLQRLHEAVLRDDDRLGGLAAASVDGTWTPMARKRTEPRTVPRELPAEAAGFTGRAAELRDLDAARTGSDADGIPPAPLIVITGMGGVGKTATAVHWARRIAADYPDGQLHLNLRGRTALPPLTPAEAVAALLRSLGHAGDQVPADPDEAAARLRTATAGRRLLVLLDDAESAAQIIPLLPAGPGSLTVATSRDRLSDLAPHGAHRLDLAPLAPADATALLKALMRIPRTEDRPDLADLARAAGYLPLALRLAAADPGRPGALAEGVAAVFDRSYRALPEDARRVLRLLAPVPVRSLSTAAAGVLAGLDPAAADLAVERLVHAHMANRDARGRLVLHDLIRDHASGLADPTERAAALDRLHHWYLDRADAACRTRHPGYARLPGPARTAPDTPEQAARWLDDERDELVAVARTATGETAWRLADILRGHAWTALATADFLALGQAALHHADGSLPGEAAAELCMSTAYVKSRDFTDAARHAERAADRAHRLGWDFGEASARHNLALATWNLGRPGTARRHGEAALAMNRAAGRTRAASVNLGALAVIAGDLGEPRTEHRLLTEALALAETADDTALAASHLRGLAAVSIALGDVPAAARALDRVTALEVGAGERELGASTAAFLADLCAAQGRHGDALAYADMVVRQADLRGDRASKAIGLAAAAAALNGAGRHEEAVAAAAQVLGLVHGELASTRIRALVERSAARIAVGAADAAEADAAQLLALAADGGYRTAEAMARNLTAEVKLLRGDAEGARVLAGSALTAHRAAGHRVGEEWSLRVLGAAVSAAE
ncbi:BTAD domain-containing putative transcriptional regulator [Glycomyces sp. NPDC047010]|uniref:AfsR/SARP family transcriptional regulator n=1 Tax=Glycomyces sp. NPDC047010 TaxID=3155023 RepID=UPI0033E73607